MPWSVSSHVLGNQPIAPFILPDSTARHTSGQVVMGADPYWGGGEFMYVRANGAIRQGGLCVITPALVKAGWTEADH